MKTKAIWSISDVIKFKSLDVLLDSFILAFVFRSMFLKIEAVRSYYSTVILADIISLILGFVLVIFAGMVFYPLMYRIRKRRAKDELSSYIVNLEEFQAMHFMWRAKYGTYLGYILFAVFIIITTKIYEVTDNLFLLMLFSIVSIVLCVIFVKFINKKMFKKTNTNAYIIDAVKNGVYDSYIPDSVSKESVINILAKGGTDTVRGAVNYIRFTKASIIITVVLGVITFGVANKLSDMLEEELSYSLNSSPSSNTYIPLPANNDNKGKKKAAYRKHQEEKNINYRKYQDKKNAFYQANQKQKKADYQYYKTAQAANRGYFNSAYDHLNRANNAQRAADSAWRDAYGR